jgi:SAM-dependent methyltransferase
MQMSILENYNYTLQGEIGGLKVKKSKNVLNVALTESFMGKRKKGIYHWVLPALLTMRQEYLLRMIDYALKERFFVVDMGCNVGYLTRYLSLRANTIGLDIDKSQLHWAKQSLRHTDFVCCDLCHLPLRESSIDLTVCASVFEHIANLDQALQDIKFVLKTNGLLAAGYPIETKLLEIIVRSFWKSESHVWDQNNKTKLDRLRNPHTHKQDFSNIRKTLKKYFVFLKIQKIPGNYLPDSLSIYENALLLKDP